MRYTAERLRHQESFQGRKIMSDLHVSLHNSVISKYILYDMMSRWKSMHISKTSNTTSCHVVHRTPPPALSRTPLPMDMRRAISAAKQEIHEHKRSRIAQH